MYVYMRIAALDVAVKMNSKHIKHFRQKYIFKVQSQFMVGNCNQVFIYTFTG